VGQLDEISEVLFEQYFNGKNDSHKKAIAKLYNTVVKRINESVEFNRVELITAETEKKLAKAWKTDKERPILEDANPKQNKKENDLLGDDEDEGDLLGDNAEDDLLGSSKPKKKKTPEGKPTTGKRVKALVEKGKTDFQAVCKILTGEGYTFTDNSVRWYISKAKKGEL
jgi:hypothetical protein